MHASTCQEFKQAPASADHRPIVNSFCPPRFTIIVAHTTHRGAQPLLHTIFTYENTRFNALRY